MTSIAILGGTSDLAKKKIYPALYELYQSGELTDINVVGTSRTDRSQAAFRELVANATCDDKEFLEHFHFVRLDFYEDEGYQTLHESVDDHTLYYLSTLPQHYTAIAERLDDNDLVGSKGKVLFEKPFGTSLESAKSLNDTVMECFDEEQVYRVDHYLDKELIKNISVLRFTNPFLEPVWNSSYIDCVEVVMAEDFGVEGRAEFYDGFGTINDVFQNHMLQLLALMTMEQPTELSDTSVTDAKVETLTQAEPVRSFTGQYAGYTEHEGVDQESTTETLAAVEAAITNERWEDVPIYMLSGKYLPDTTVQVYIEFRNTGCAVFDDGCPVDANAFVLQVKPEQTVFFKINTKTPGEDDITTSRMEHCYSCEYGHRTPKAYTNLLRDALRGKKTSFVRADEIIAEWEFVEAIDKPNPVTYERGTIPEGAEAFNPYGWHV